MRQSILFFTTHSGCSYPKTSIRRKSPSRGLPSTSSSPRWSTPLGGERAKAQYLLGGKDDSMILKEPNKAAFVEQPFPQRTPSAQQPWSPTPRKCFDLLIKNFLILFALGKAGSDLVNLKFGLLRSLSFSLSQDGLVFQLDYFGS